VHVDDPLDVDVVLRIDVEAARGVELDGDAYDEGDDDEEEARPVEEIVPNMRWDGMGRDGTGWDGMGWDGMGRDGTRWDGMGWDGMGWMAGLVLHIREVGEGGARAAELEELLDHLCGRPYEKEGLDDELLHLRSNEIRPDATKSMR
jgi:hypothetical protein